MASKQIQSVIDSIHRKLTEAATTIVQGVTVTPDPAVIEDDHLVIYFELETKTCILLEAEVLISMEGDVFLTCFYEKRRQGRQCLSPNKAVESINAFFNKYKDA